MSRANGGTTAKVSRPARPADKAAVNEVRLCGTVTSAPEKRALPSGDQIVTFRISVRREPTVMTRGSRQKVDVVDCCAWSAAARRSAERVAVGDGVEVSGALRRRFYRSATGAASRVEVEVSRVGRR